MHARHPAPDPPPPPVAVALDPATATVVGEIETILHEALSSLAPAPTPRGPGRPRSLPAICLWAGLLVSLVRGVRHQNAIFRLLTQARDVG